MAADEPITDDQQTTEAHRVPGCDLPQRPTSAPTAHSEAAAANGPSRFSRDTDTIHRVLAKLTELDVA